MPRARRAQAAQEGRLREMFGCGTACIVQPIDGLVRASGQVIAAPWDAARPPLADAAPHARAHRHPVRPVGGPAGRRVWPRVCAACGGASWRGAFTLS